MDGESGRAATEPVGIDLVAPEVFAPMLRRLALAAIGIGAGVGALSALWLSWPYALGLGLVVAVPTIVYVFAFRRRRMWLSGTEIRAQRLFGEHRIDLAEASGVQLLVFPARLSRIVLKVTAGADTQLIPLAMYTDAGSGRELHLLGLRKLADALSASQLAAAVVIAEVLVQQLRAEARDAGLGERPLYRGVRLVRAKDSVSPVVLTDAQVAELV
ncbi:hypothetical protein FEK33_22285 [Nocardia asteroides NBRC 15531]|uniref:Uncharacterized protein n=1 Tax=Nocardia asteroides NBRC 15531 TaxID=1110697 RepID=U5E4C9_NOCAS|nr:hypothetical protein [Nocardia asteroides]TLF64372.1 hypothetical protein FEK33_22285 [Nocardia asteroides NBRC 15531]UGT50523.1 hypothetical protein LT345_08190 [Nocardia asteroides]SFN35702.1 hypothetical protein SAMN05444423_108235 [Nocardia asteroides]VEG36668.1 Uncharacterised protein [Nocardia asteroides]GAD84062.1 hypothetical protein NCAST_21_00110 [Nocardia asteroides NBRC 15531]